MTGQAELLVPIAALAWFTVGLTVEIVLRAARPVLATIVLGVGVIGSVLLATGRTDRPVLGAATACLVLVFIAITASIGPDDAVTLLELGDAQVRRAAWPVLAAVAVAAGAAFASANVTSALPFTSEPNRFDVRDHILPPVEPPTQDLSPIVRTKSQLNQDPAPVVFTVDFDGPAPEGPLLFRTAALDVYDGVLWTSNSLFRRTASVLPHDDAAIGDVVSYRVRLTPDFPYDYVPLLGDPLSTTLVDGGFDEATDTLIVAAGNRSDFEASSRFVSPLDVPAGGVDASEGSAVEPFVALPATVPDDLREFFAEAIGDADTAVGRLQALQSRLTDGSFAYNTTAPSGSSLAAIETYLGLREASDGTSASGYAEQAAAAFALGARLEGIPARVAVGYRVDPAQVQGSTIEVTTAEAHVWVETSLDGLGWVPFDPIIRGERTLEPPPPPAVQFTPDAEDPVAEPTEAQAAAQPRAIAGDSLWRRLASLRFLGLAGLALVVGVPIAKLIRRRRRLGGADPAQRVLGAWLEVRDGCIEQGLAVSPAMTAADVIRSARDHGLLDPDDKAGDQLVGLVQWAGFRPEDLTPQDASLALEYERTLRRSLAAGRSILRRFVAWPDPRPLLGAGVQRRGRLGWKPDHDPFDAQPFDPFANERAAIPTTVDLSRPDKQVVDLREETSAGPQLGA